MGMISIRCPHCGQELNIDDKHAGQTGACRGCGKPITVPKAEEVGTADAGYAGFSIQTEEQASGTPAEKPKKPPVMRKDDRDSGAFGNAIMWAVAGLLLILGCVVVVKLVMSSLDDTVRETETTGKVLSDSVLPDKSIDEVLADLPKQNPRIKWLEVEGTNVFIGYDLQGKPKSAAPRRTADNAAILASEANQATVTSYLVDASAAQKGWRPGTPGAVYKSVALQGETSERENL